MIPTMLYSFSASGKKREGEKKNTATEDSAPIIILLAKLIIYSVYANSRKAGPLNNQTAKTLKIQTKWRKQPGALESHTQHSRGLLLLIAAKSASIDMLNRLASLITGQVNVAHADPWGEAVQRPIVWVSYQDLLLPLCAKRYTPIYVTANAIRKRFKSAFQKLGWEKKFAVLKSFAKNIYITEMYKGNKMEEKILFFTLLYWYYLQARKNRHNCTENHVIQAPQL